MKTKILFLIVASISILGFSCCERGIIYESYHKLEEAQWHQDSTLLFSPHIESITDPVDIDIRIRNSNNYMYSNLWLFIKTETPSGKTYKDTVEVPMADHKGKWLGKGLGDTFELNYPYKLNRQLPDTGVYKIEVTQGMRSEQGYIEGIRDIGLRIDLTRYTSGKE